MDDNYSLSEKLILMNPKEIQLNFASEGVELYHGWISLSPDAIKTALGSEYVPQTMKINELSVPFDA